MTLIGSLQLIGIGMLGEYLGRTYLESKRRPVYLMRSIHEPPQGVKPDRKGSSPPIETSSGG